MDGAWAPPMELINTWYYTAEIIQAYMDQIIEGKAQSRYGRITVVEFNFHIMHEIFVKDLNPRFYKMTKTILPDRREEYFHEPSGVKFVFHPIFDKDYHRGGYPQMGCPFVPCQQLIVANMAWDGNSWIVNEYWGHSRKEGTLSYSGDSAAACCPTLWNHLHPDLNREYMSGDRTIVSLEKGGFKPL